MNSLLTKAWRDLKGAPGRAAVLAVAVGTGTASLATMVTASSVLEREVPRSFESALPPHIIVAASDEVPNEAVATLLASTEIDGAEARRLIRGRARLADGSWLPMLAFVVEDFDGLTVSRFTPDSGDWPPPLGAVLLERSARPVVGPVSTLTLRAPGVEVEVPIAGEVHDGALPPAWQDLDVPVYLSRETAGLLGLPAGLDEVHLRATEGTPLSDVAERARRVLEQGGVEVLRVETPTQRHPHQDHVDALLVMLRVFSALTIALAAVLAANLSAARVASHRSQIAILKAIGARRWQVAVPYLAFVALPAAVGALAGAPIGLLLGRAFASMAATQLNLGDPDLWPDGGPLLLAAAITWLVPVVAGSWPLRRGLVLTVREGLAPPEPPVSWLRMPMPSLLALASRTLAARPLRLLGTLGTLSLGGAILMTAVNARSSLVEVVWQQMSVRDDDIEVRLMRPAEAAALLEAAAVDGVEAVEPWGLALVSLVRGDDTATERFGLHAPPPGFQHPTVLHGRWLDNSGEAVANAVLTARYPEVTVGSRVRVRSSKGERSLLVVGVVEEVAEPALYSDVSTTAFFAGVPNGHVGAARVAVDPAADPAQVGDRIEQKLIQAGMFPLMVMPRNVLAEAMTEHFGILTAVLAMIALGSVVVGGLSLGTSLALTTMEHRREIGIVKAIGGTSRAVLTWVVLEGAIVAVLAAITSAILSLPMSLLVVTMLGEHGLNVHVPLVVSPTGVGAWLLILGFVTTVATWWPARAASRMPVHGVLRAE